MIDFASPPENSHHDFRGKASVALAEFRNLPALKKVGGKGASGINLNEDFKSDFPGGRDVRQSC